MLLEFNIRASRRLSRKRRVQNTLSPQKLKASFRPSRHWGPRDPIMHYYWMARREEAERGPAGAAGRPRSRRPPPGRLAGAAFPSPAAPGPLASTDLNCNELKRRSNSDDWIYTVHRRKYIEEDFSTSKRSLSLDWGKLPRVKRDSVRVTTLGSVYLTPAESRETVFRDAISEVKNSIAKSRF